MENNSGCLGVMVLVLIVAWFLMLLGGGIFAALGWATLGYGTWVLITAALYIIGMILK